MSSYLIATDQEAVVYVRSNLEEIRDENRIIKVVGTQTPDTIDASITTNSPSSATSNLPTGSGASLGIQHLEHSDQLVITICISEQEKQLLRLLKNVTELYNRNLIDDSSPLIVRIAGGWVRDKVLGYPYDQNTNDIDIAINIISGVQFAELVQTYVLSQAEQSFDNAKENSSSDTTPLPMTMNPNMQ